MHDERAGFGELHEFGIDLVTAQHADALSRLGFLAHGDPNVGVEQIRSSGSTFQIFRANDVAAGAL